MALIGIDRFHGLVRAGGNSRLFDHKLGLPELDSRHFGMVLVYAIDRW